MIADALVIAVLFLAVRSDLRDRVIPNWVTIPAALIGLGLNGVLFGVDGLRMAALGWGAGAAILFVPFALGWMGGGDAKLAAALGALKGPAFTIEATLYATVIAGVMAAIYLVRTGRLATVVRDIPRFWTRPVLPAEARGHGRIPFGPAAALGGLVALGSVYILPALRGL